MKKDNYALVSYLVCKPDKIRQNVPKYHPGPDFWPLPEALARITRTKVVLARKNKEQGSGSTPALYLHLHHGWLPLGTMVKSTFEKKGVSKFQNRICSLKADLSKAAWTSMALTTPSLTSNRRSSSTLELGSVGESILFSLNPTVHHRNKFTQQHIVVSIWMLI